MRPLPRLIILGTFLAAALLLGFPAPAQATGTVLVSNTGQIDAGGLTHVGVADYAQSFHTGGNVLGYDLTIITLDLLTAPGSGTLTVVVRPYASGVPGDTVLYTMFNPATVETGLQEFTAPAGAHLNPNAIYFVHMSYSGGGTNPGWSGTTSTVEDSGADPEWGIGDSTHFYDDGIWYNIYYPLRIKVSGVRLLPPAPTGLTATAGDQQVELSWDDPGDSTITKYQYSTDGGETFQNISGSNSATTAYTVTGLTNGTEYTLAVRAVNASANGAVSTVTVRPRWAAQMEISNIPGGPTGDRSIDLSHGSVHTSFSLGGTVDGSSPAYNLKASYSSNVKGAVKAWIHSYQAGELGLGWAVEHPRIIRMNNGTGQEGDDRFVYYAAGHGIQSLKYLSSGGGFENYGFEDVYQPTTRIQRFAGDDDSYWVVTLPNGVKYYYGGQWGREDPTNYSDDFKQVCRHLQEDAPAEGRCQSGAIEYGVQWGDWVGASQNPKNQTNIPVVWNLSRIESITGHATVLSYVNNIQDVGRQVGNLTPKAFSRSAYLYRVRQPSGAKTVIAYCPMADGSGDAGPTLENEAPPAAHEPVNTVLNYDFYSDICGAFPGVSYAEFADPHVESPEPDGYQERLKTVFIGGTVSFVAGNNSPTGQITLMYDFLKGESAGADMAKRILTGVQRKTFSEEQDNMLSTTPPTLFSYWGQSRDDGVHVGDTDFSNIFNEENGAYYGAIKSITSSTGLTKTYTYKKQELDIARELEVPSDIRSSRTALFSDGYILLVGADSDDIFTLDLVEWTSRGWEITYTYSGGEYPDTADGDLHPYDVHNLVTMQPAFFAFATAQADQIKIVSKSQSSVWRNLDTIELPAIEDDPNVAIELRSDRETIFYLHTEPRQPLYPDSWTRHFVVGNYHVDSGETNGEFLEMEVDGERGIHGEGEDNPYDEYEGYSLEDFLEAVTSGSIASVVETVIDWITGSGSGSDSNDDPMTLEELTKYILETEPERGRASAAIAVADGRVGLAVAETDIRVKSKVAIIDRKANTWSKSRSANSWRNWCLANYGNGLYEGDEPTCAKMTSYGGFEARFDGNTLLATISGLSFDDDTVHGDKPQYFDLAVPFVLGPNLKIFGAGGKCLHVEDGNGANGTDIDLAGCASSRDSVIWTYDDLSGEIRGMRSKCLDIEGGELYENGAQIQIYECHGKDNQKWRFDTESGQIRQGLLWGTHCIDIEGQPINGAKVVTQVCNDSQSQRWELVETEGYNLTPVYYDLRNVTVDRRGNMPYTVVNDPALDGWLTEDQIEFPFLLTAANATEQELLDREIKMIGVFNQARFDLYEDIDGVGSFIAEYWPYVWHSSELGSEPWSWHADAPMKYAASAGFQASNGQMFHSSYLQVRRMLADVRLGGYFLNDYEENHASSRADVLTANCTYVAFDGSRLVDEPIYFNPYQLTGWLQRYDNHEDLRTWLSKRVYVNPEAAEIPDLGCVGAVSLGGDALTTYNGTGRREYLALYPRLKRDGTSVMSRSLGDVSELGEQLTIDDIHRYTAIARAEEKLKKIQTEGEVLNDINYALMGASMVLDIITENWVGLVQNVLMSAIMVGLSEQMQIMAKMDQAAIQNAVHKLGSVHQDANVSGSGFSLYNTALLYRETDGTVGYKGDIQDGVSDFGDSLGLGVVPERIKKYDLGSGVVTFQTRSTPYVRTLVNGTIGVASPVSTGNTSNMTAGEENDVYALGLGRNFITYQKVGHNGKYTCRKRDKGRLSRFPFTEKYDDPCLFGARGKVFVHRMIDEAGVGNVESIVVDAVTFDDGLQTTKVEYVFETASASHDRDNANYKKAAIHPGGRNGDNGRIVHYMYSGVENNVSLACERLNVETNAYTDCPNDNGHGKVVSHVYRDHLRGQVYQRRVHEHNDSSPQLLTRTEHKIQVIERSGYPDAVRVLPVRTDRTRDNVTTVTNYHYNQYGQKTQTEVISNNYDHATAMVREEVINTSRVYAWETDAYGADFESANRYMDVVQTTLQRTMGDQIDGTRIVDAKASSYTQVDIDGLGSPVYLPKRSYVYQASAGESTTPVFNPSQPGSNWIALLETESYDSVTGAPTATKNSQTGLASSMLLTENRPKVPYAKFGNAIVERLEASYTGFETYEDQDHVSNFTLANGAVKPYGFAGEQAYGANTGTVRVTVDRYTAAAHDRPALLSAWVRPRNGQICQLRIGDKSAESQPGDGQTWQYLEVAAYVEGGDGFSVSCGSGGYIDEVLMRPVDSTFSATAHDSHYRLTDTIGNNGIVTHLLRDHHNRVVASYGHDHTGKPRILGLPVAGFSRYNGFGSEPERPALDDFTQSQPNHNATVVFQDEDHTQVHPGSTAGRTLELEDSRRFALQAIIGDVIDITVEDIDGGEISLSTQTDPATLEKKFSLNQGGFYELSDSVAAPRADQVLTWVVMDQFSAVFLDGKMLISTDGLSGRPDSGPSTVTFNLGRYSDVLVGHDPVLTRSFHDGFGRTIQTQSIGLDARDEPTRVKISQVLYDGWGKPAVQTKLAMRQQPLGDYHTGYVSSFDWSNDRISGEIKDVFNGQGEGRPFTRTRYTDSPLLRPARQSLLPGNDFRLNGQRARTFSYGSTEQTEDDSLLGENDLYVVQKLLPFTDETRLETNVITDKAGRTVSTTLGNETQFGYIEWKYQHDYGTGNAFQTTTGFTPNYNAATVAGHQYFKNIATSWDNRSTVTTSQEPDLSGYALVVRDNLGRPRFMRKNVAGLTGNISGVSYISYDRPGRIRETGVLKDVSNTLAGYRTLANNLDFPNSSQTCWQKRYLYDTDLQTGNKQKFLTGRVFGLVSNMNLIVDNPANSCFDGGDKGKSHIFYKYDQRGRVIGISEVTNTSLRNSAYQYNNLGARLAVTYPNIGRMTYDDRTAGFGNLSRDRKQELLFKSDGQMTVHYPRNLLGQLREVCDSADCGGVKYASQYRYDVFGKVLGNRLNEDSLEQGRTYDFQERLASLETEQDSTMVFSEKLSYEPYQGGNIGEAQYTGTGLGGQEHSYQYKYDIWGRLPEAERFEGYNLDTRSRKYRYTYDHNGNMLTRTILGAADSDVLENHAYNYEPGKNQLNSITDSVSGEVRYFSHNDHGAVTSFTNKSGNTNQYTLDSRDDRVYRVTNNDGFSAEYAYDPLNRRIRRISTGGPDISPPYVSLLDLAGEDDTGASETDNITNQTGDLTITGCAEAGSTITLYQNGELIDGTVSADISDGDCGGAGNQFTKDIGLANDGVYEITAVAVDAAGNETASAALTITLDSVTIAPAAVDNALTIIGCAEAGSTITLYRNGELIDGTVLADNSDGACGGDERQFVKDIDLETGVYEITFVAEDPAGNRSPVSEALTVGVANRALDLASEDDSGRSESDNLTNQTSGLTITGCATADSTITLYVDGDPIDGTVSANNSNVDCGDGSNQFTKDIDLETDGVYEITAVAVDDAGIGTTPATGLTITIDTFASPPPAALDLEARDDTGDSDTDNMTTQTSDLTITGCAEAGNEIAFYRDGELIEGVVSVDNSDGACSGGEGQFVKEIDLQTNSVYQITAVAEDPAGNQSSHSVALTIGVFQMPSAPENLMAAPDSTRVVLEWDTVGFEVTDYLVRSQAVGSSGDPAEKVVAAGSGTRTTAEVTGLTNGTEYVFTVHFAEVSGTETVTTSRGVSVSDTPMVAVPAAPADLTATPGDREVAVIWDDPGDITIMKYQYSTDGGVNFNDMNGSSKDTASFTFENLTNWTEYTLAIRASNLSGEGSAATVTTTPAAAPANLAATPGVGQVSLSWDDPGNVGITKYQLMRQAVIEIASTDGAGGDRFGYSVAIDGGTAVTGAYQEDENGNDSGSAYVFTRDSGSDVWSQRAKLTASDGANGDNFGYSVAIDGDTVMVGAHHHNGGNGNNSGAVYVFTKPANGWADAEETVKLTASSAGVRDLFGSSIALKGNTAVIGAYEDSHGGVTRAGSAYVFAKDSSGVWGQTAKLTASDGEYEDWFGYSVALDGDTVLVGAKLDAHGAQLLSGSAYVFTKPAGGWADANETVKLTIANTGDRFGHSVAVDGDTAMVGAHLDDIEGPNTGSVYVFTRNASGVWSQQAALTASDAENHDWFGSSISLDGDTAAIGAYGDDDKGSDAGSVYLFTRGSSGWNETAKFTASDGADDHQLGGAVALDGNFVVAGAYGGTGMASNSGSAYILGIGTDWTDISGSGAATTSTQVTGLAGGAEYTFGIRAANPAGTGPASSVAVSPLWPAPVNLTAEGDSGGVVLQWDTGDYRITNYLVEIEATSGAGDPPEMLVSPGPGTTTTAEVTSLTNGAEYTFTVQPAKVSGGETVVTGTAATVTATPLLPAPENVVAVPAAPTGLAATPGDGEVAVTWEHPGNITITNYGYSTDGGSTFTGIPDSDRDTTAFTFSNLANGTEYTLAIRAANLSGEGTGATVTATPLLPAPTNLVAARDSTRVVLQWDTGDLSITNYLIRTEVAGGSGDPAEKVVAAGSGTRTMADVTGLTNGTEYTFSVMAAEVSGTDTVATGMAASVTKTPAVALPAAPANFTATVGHGQVAVSWDNPGNMTISKYQYSTNGGSTFTDIPNSNEDTTSFTFSNLTDGTEYTLAIRASNLSGGSPGATVTVTPGWPAPTNLVAGVDSGRVVLQWDTGDPAITDYLVRTIDYWNGGAWGTLVSAGSGTRTTAEVTSLTNGTEYIFTVQAAEVSGDQTVPAGAKSSLFATPTVSVPATPANLTATPGDGQVVVSWDDPGNITIRKYQYSTDGGTTFHHMNGSDRDTTSFTFSNLTNGTEYTLAIRASNLSGESTAATVTATPLLPAPTGLLAARDSTRVVLRWDTGGSEVTNYLVRTEITGGNGDPEEKVVAPWSGSRTITAVTSLTDGTEYTFSVMAAEVSGTNTVVTGMAASVTETPGVVVPTAPTGLTATPGDGQVAVTWDNPGNITIRKYQHSTDGGATFNHMNGSNRNTTSHTITGLTNGTEYTLAIRASNLSGESTTATVTATPSS